MGTTTWKKPDHPRAIPFQSIQNRAPPGIYAACRTCYREAWAIDSKWLETRYGISQKFQEWISYLKKRMKGNAKSGDALWIRRRNKLNSHYSSPYSIVREATLRGEYETEYDHLTYVDERVP